MLFDSWIFAAFALLVFPLYYGLSLRPQNLLLLAASYVFYGAWDPRFLSLILLSTLLDWFLGKGIARSENPRRRRFFLFLSCAGNLGILGFFKYFGFFSESLRGLFHAMGFEVPALTLEIVLPVGISFYTFQTMSYTIDIYRGTLRPARRFLDFALFVAYFPQLVAGPIERASRLLPQLEKQRSIEARSLREGAWLILFGLFKKAVIADNLGVLVDRAFADGADPSGVTSLLAIYAFAYQIYCDFSGYSDIARGLAKLMGIELCKNFNRPYLARSPKEFWERWHISLSTWLRDYLYIPLGGNRGGKSATYRNLLLTMLLGGLWHGAAWTFVLWGLYQGLLLIAARALKLRLPLPESLRPLVERIVMFQFICLGWLIFRAQSLEQILAMLSSIATEFRLDSSSAALFFQLVSLGGMLWFLEALVRNEDDPLEIRGWQGLVGPALVTMLVLALVVLTPPGGRAFLYFQF